MGLEDIVSSVRSTLPWFGFFQTCYWVTRNVFVSSEMDLLFFPKAVVQRLNPTDQSYWASCVVSSIHAIIVTGYALFAGWTGGLFQSNDLHYTTEDTTTCIRIFVGYMLSDLLVVLYYFHDFPGSVAMLIHHLVIGTAFLDFGSHGFAHNLALSTLLFEATTPFLNYRWFFAKSGIQESHPRLYLMNGLTFTFIWFAVRICLGGYVGYWIYEMKDQINHDLPPIQRYYSIYGTYMIAYTLQWFWFIKIVKGALKLLRKKNN